MTGAFVVGGLTGGWLAHALQQPLSIPETPDSTRFLDRHGELLNATPVAEQALGDWQPSIDQPVILAFLAAEDHRFYDHPGIDAVAIGRAGKTNILAGETREGASTITQQLVRRLWPRPPGLEGKLWEAWTALRVESTLEKEEILVQYLNRIYFGNHSYGIDAAARTYLGKAPDKLSIAEAALLAALPRSPEALNPLKNPRGARDARNIVIDRMQELGWIDPLDADAAREQPLGLRESPAWSHAPHLVRRIDPQPGNIQTTLDLRLQTQVQTIIDEEIAALERHQVSHAAVIVVDNQSAEVLAYVGSAEWTSPDGQVDGAMALRSPGSALKPFAYWMGIERGLDDGGITLSTVLEDLPGSWHGTHGTWSPNNYDRNFHGPVQVREALARSLNLPAVRVLERVGTSEFQRRLQDLGLTTLDKGPAHYGLGLVLGNAEVRLDELTAAYLALSRHGLYRPLRWLKEPSSQADEAARIVGRPTAAWLILDALDDADARAASFMRESPLEPPFPMAAKTGTSVGFRDNWAFGITSEHTIGVWVGNFDGEPMDNLSGVAGAGPILNRIAQFLNIDRSPLKPATETVEKARVCLLSGLRQEDACPGGRVERFLSGTAPEETCSWHRRIEVDEFGALATGCPNTQERLAIRWPGEFAEWAHKQDLPSWPTNDHSCTEKMDTPPPPKVGRPGIIWPESGSVFYLDPRDPPEFQAITLRANLPLDSQEVGWWVNDTFLGFVESPFSFRWVPSMGNHVLQLKRGNHTVDQVELWVGGQTEADQVPHRKDENSP